MEYVVVTLDIIQHFKSNTICKLNGTMKLVLKEVKRLNSVVSSFKGIFSTISISYLVKSYLIAFTFIWLYFQVASTQGEKLYFILCGLLFPFATLAWDSIISFLFKGHVIILHVIVLIMWNLAKWMILFLVAPVIAPITILFLYIMKRFYSRAN